VVLVDGVRVNSAQPQGAISSMIDAGLLDRVEVVKRSDLGSARQRRTWRCR